MKYAPAIAMNALSEDFSGPEERAARRARRQARRAARKEKKLRKLRRETRQARREAGMPVRRRRRGAAAAASSTALVATRAPSLQPAPNRLPDDAPIDAEWEDVEPADGGDEGADDEMEGIGAFQPLRRLAERGRAAASRVQSGVASARAGVRSGITNARAGVRARVDARRARVDARVDARSAARAARAAPGALAVPTGLAAPEAGWGPSVALGRQLRIQARMGHRAAVIDLKPGLFLVAEIPEAVTRTEFGIAPLLAPLMVNAASQALNPNQAPQRRGPLAALFQRGQRAQQGDKPLRLFRARAKAAPAATPTDGSPAPLALPGPVASPPGGSFLLPAPNVGWADNATVAEVLGCEACEEGW